MFLRLFKPMRFLTKAFLSQDTPKQLALGLAIGMLVGIVPKGNLLAVMLGMLLLSVRVNLAVGMISAVAFTWIGSLFDRLAHLIGDQLLHLNVLQGFWAWLSDVPLLPWTAYNNTVVLGSLVLGLYLFVPVYLLGLMAFERYQPWAKEIIEKYRVRRILNKAELVERVRTASR